MLHTSYSEGLLLCCPDVPESKWGLLLYARDLSFSFRVGKNERTAQPSSYGSAGSRSVLLTTAEEKLSARVSHILAKSKPFHLNDSLEILLAES